MGSGGQAGKPYFLNTLITKFQFFISIMNISIVRYRLKTESIDGRLYIDGQHICDTAENAEIHIPVGTYPVVATKCQVRKRNIPVINLHESICRNCEACSLVAEKNE